MGFGSWLDRRFVGGELVHDSGVLEGWDVGIAWSRRCVRMFRREERLRIAVRSSGFMILGAAVSYQAFDATPDALRRVRAACDEAEALLAAAGAPAGEPAPGALGWLECLIFTGALVRDHGTLEESQTGSGRSRVCLRLCRRFGRLRFVFRHGASGPGCFGVQYGILQATPAAIRALRETCDIAERRAGSASRVPEA